MKAVVNVFVDDTALMLSFALTLILAGLLLIAFAIQSNLEGDGYWLLASGSFVLGFGVRCLMLALSDRHRPPPP